LHLSVVKLIGRLEMIDKHRHSNTEELFMNTTRNLGKHKPKLTSLHRNKIHFKLLFVHYCI